MKFRTILLTLSIVLITMSCKTLNKNISYSQMLQNTSVEAKMLRQNPDFKTCVIDENKRFGEINLKNNLWGRTKLDKGVPKLCTYKRGDYFGWSWELPNNSGGVIGYPAIEVGRSPWGSAKTKIDGFPVKVSAIDELSVDYDFETHVKYKKYNLAFDLWLTDVEFGGGKNITTEIMIWEDYFDFTSYGKVKETIITPFGVYKVHIGQLVNKNFLQDWKYIAFVRTSPRTAGKVDIKHLLDYLIKINEINPDHYFTSVELGNEIGNSSGFTMVKEFDLNFKTD